VGSPEEASRYPATGSSHGCRGGSSVKEQASKGPGEEALESTSAPTGINGCMTYARRRGDRTTLIPVNRSGHTLLHAL
jgi:hypothetical protein